MYALFGLDPAQFVVLLIVVVLLIGWAVWRPLSRAGPRGVARTDEQTVSTRENLRSIAVYQKGVLVCILVAVAYLVVMVIAAIPLAKEAVWLLWLLRLGLLVIHAVAFVFVCLLAVKVYSKGVGVVLALLTLIPTLGLIPLVLVNLKATEVLKKHGYRVGLLGASLSQFKE
jgi:hypothetical protein